MSYIIKQYNHINIENNEGVITENNSGSFMTPIVENSVYNIEVKATRKDSLKAYNIVDEDEQNDNETSFYNECLYYSHNFKARNNYFLRCLIQKQVEPMEFYIKLAHKEDTEQTVEQYIKTVVIPGGLPTDDWAIVEIMFQPKIDFNILLFQLKRDIYDYQKYPRYPKIAYQQLCHIENGIDILGTEGKDLLKIGVQSHPGLKMCINGEEINASRSGIYEIKNGVLPVSFFSVVSNLILDEQNKSKIKINPIVQDQDKKFIINGESDSSEEEEEVIEEDSFGPTAKQLTYELIKNLIYNKADITDDSIWLPIVNQIISIDTETENVEEKYNSIMNLIQELIRTKKGTLLNIKDYDEWYDFIHNIIIEILFNYNYETASVQINKLKEELETEKNSILNLNLKEWQKRMNYFVTQINKIEKLKRLDNILPTESDFYKAIAELYSHTTLQSREFLKEHANFVINPFTLDYMFEKLNSTDTENTD